MTSDDDETESLQPPPGRFWIIRRAWPYLRPVIWSLVPRPDPVARNRMRRAARKLVTVDAWPEMAATSDQAAQLAMLRLLWLQRKTRSAVRLRQREASAMLARASIETLFLGMYCLREPDAIGQLHAGNLKALNAGLAYLGELGIVPVTVIRECTAALGEPADRYLGVAEMADAIDKASGDEKKPARGIYNRLYGPLSNFTVHASGGTLMRHVRRKGGLRERPSRAWARRSPAEIADAAAGFLAADLALRGGKPHQMLISYADRHEARVLLPMAVMAFTGSGGGFRLLRIRESLGIARELWTYLWTGPASADSLEVRAACIRERFAGMLDLGPSDIPEGAMDPFINYVADWLASHVPEPKPA